jgi:hypothetical protein
MVLKVKCVKWTNWFNRELSHTQPTGYKILTVYAKLKSAIRNENKEYQTEKGR